MKVYISGKITGINLEDCQAKFEKTKERLKLLGHEVVNPLEIAPYDPDKTWEDYMIDDIRELFKCDAICMQEDWFLSKGAKVEKAIAQELELKIFYQQGLRIFGMPTK